MFIRIAMCINKAHYHDFNLKLNHRGRYKVKYMLFIDNCTSVLEIYIFLVFKALQAATMQRQTYVACLALTSMGRDHLTSGSYYYTS